MIKKKPSSLKRASENGYPTYEEVQSRPGAGDSSKYRDGDIDHYLGHIIKSLIYKDGSNIVILMKIAMSSGVPMQCLMKE